MTIATRVPVNIRAAAMLELRKRQGNTTDNNHYPPMSHADFAARRLRILDKNKLLVPFHYNAVQSDLMANLTGRDLVLKARQVGISTAIQGMLYQQSVTNSATTMTLAHDDDSTQKLRRIAERFYRNDPDKPERGHANARLTTYPSHDSEAMIATAGNRTSGRSATLSHLHGSEVAFWPNAEDLIGAAVQAGNPAVILESTPNGAQGYFYNLCMEALDGGSAWALHFYAWWWDANYRLPLADGETLTYTNEEALLASKHGLIPEQIKWRRAKQLELKQLFIQEYPEDPLTCFLRSGYGYFGDVTDCLKAAMSTTPDSTHHYVAGLDFGQTKDYTVLIIIDVTAMRMVHMVRINQLAWATMRERVVQACKWWNVDVLTAERNSMGQTNIEELRNEMDEADCATGIIRFDMTNESKASIMSALNEALQRRSLQLQDDPVLRHELSAFTATQLPSGAWRLAAPEGEHDDTVIALALAYRGVSHGVWSF